MGQLVKACCMNTMAQESTQGSFVSKNSEECGVSSVSTLSQDRAKRKNLTKVYAAAAAADNTRKEAHISHFC